MPHHHVNCFVGFALAVLLVSATSTAATQDSSSEISVGEAVEAVTQAMRERGLTPPLDGGLTLEDYVSVRETGGTRHVRLFVGSDGNLIPSGEWRDAHPGYCEGEGRHTTGAKKAVNFKFNRIPGGHYAFMQLLDVESGRIEGQREGQGSGGEEGLAEAIDDVWKPGGLGELAGPCGSRTEPDVSVPERPGPPANAPSGVKPGTAYFFSTGEVEVEVPRATGWNILHLTTDGRSTYSLVLFSAPDYGINIVFPDDARAGDTFSLTYSPRRERPSASFDYSPPGGAFSDTDRGHQGSYDEGVSGQLHITSRTESTVSGKFSFSAHDTDLDSEEVYAVDVQGGFYILKLPD